MSLGLDELEESGYLTKKELRLESSRETLVFVEYLRINHDYVDAFYNYRAGDRNLVIEFFDKWLELDYKPTCSRGFRINRFGVGYGRFYLTWA